MQSPQNLAKYFKYDAHHQMIKLYGFGYSTKYPPCGLTHPFTTKLPPYATANKVDIEFKVNLVLGLLILDKTDVLKEAFQCSGEQPVVFDKPDNSIDFTRTYFAETGLPFNQIVAAQSAAAIDLLLTHQPPTEQERAALVTMATDSTPFHPWRVKFFETVFLQEAQIENSDFINRLAELLLEHFETVKTWGDANFLQKVIAFVSKRILRGANATAKQCQQLVTELMQFQKLPIDVPEPDESTCKIILALYTSEELNTFLLRRHRDAFLQMYLNYRSNPQEPEKCFKQLFSIARENCKLPFDHVIYQALKQAFEGAANENELLLTGILQLQINCGESEQVVEQIGRLSDGFRVRFQIQLGRSEDVTDISVRENLLVAAAKSENPKAKFELARFYCIHKRFTTMRKHEVIDEIYRGIENGYCTFTDAYWMVGTMCANSKFNVSNDRPPRKYNPVIFNCVVKAALMNKDSDAIRLFNYKFNDYSGWGTESISSDPTIVCLSAMLQDKYNPRSPNKFARGAKQFLPKNINAWQLHYARAIRFKEGSLGSDPYKRCIYLAVAHVLMPENGKTILDDFVKQEIIYYLTEYSRSQDHALSELAKHLLTVVDPINYAGFITEQLNKKALQILNESVNSEQKDLLLPHGIMNKLHSHGERQLANTTYPAAMAFDKGPAPSAPALSEDEEESEEQQDKLALPPRWLAFTNENSALVRAKQEWQLREQQASKQAQEHLELAERRPGDRRSFP